MTDWYPNLSKHPWEMQQFARRVFDGLYALRDHVAALPQSLTADQLALIQKALQVGGSFPLNVGGLSGILAQPQVFFLFPQNIILANAIPGIMTNTPDANDVKYVSICGGGGLGPDRGAIIYLYGNEYGAGAFGKLTLRAGNVFFATTDGSIDLQTQNLSRLLIDYAGHVGIGTITALAKLAINGGLHVGGDSDPGDNNTLIDGILEIVGLTKTTGGIHIGGSSDPGAGNAAVDGTLQVTGLTKTTGGLHVGGTSDPGADNTLIDGTLEVTSTIKNSALTASKPVFTDASKILSSSGTVPVDQGGTGATDAATARSNLGLGTIATHNVGANGTFLSGDAIPKTITVANGIITSIV